MILNFFYAPSLLDVFRYVDGTRGDAGYYVCPNNRLYIVRDKENMEVVWVVPLRT